MGHTTNIYGYIQVEEKLVDAAIRAISNFKFDDVYPFRHCFSAPIKSYRYHTIAYADSHKMVDETDWNQWTCRFEQLLNSFEYVSAVTNYEPEERSDVFRIDYIKVGDQIEKLIVKHDRLALKE